MLSSCSLQLRKHRLSGSNSITGWFGFPEMTAFAWSWMIQFGTREMFVNGSVITNVSWRRIGLDRHFSVVTSMKNRLWKVGSWQWKNYWCNKHYLELTWFHDSNTEKSSLQRIVLAIWAKTYLVKSLSACLIVRFSSLDSPGLINTSSLQDINASSNPNDWFHTIGSSVDETIRNRIQPHSQSPLYTSR